MFELIFELIAAINIIIDIDSLKYVIFDARLNISRPELTKFLKINQIFSHGESQNLRIIKNVI